MSVSTLKLAWQVPEAEGVAGSKEKLIWHPSPGRVVVPRHERCFSKSLRRPSSDSGFTVNAPPSPLLTVTDREGPA